MIGNTKAESPSIVQSILRGATPNAWVEYAVSHLDILLVDQANCEKKAASSAISLLYRNEHDPRYLRQLSRLAREELKHFELVVKALNEFGIEYQRLGPSRYAKNLHKWIRPSPANHRFLDQLLVAAMIEARSCERIGVLIPHFNGKLLKLYEQLHESEGRHFEIYLEFAAEVCGERELERRLAELREYEALQINSSDSEFRFHSGIPVFVDESYDSTSTE
ncbi:MAG: tRNA-(ms[2]io[6]A)-hydroxylase [Gammaproteobacteria bacterium]|nr:tRNA-(ms[2]io[6]A)-hydroxylase [Gammaproteobacteria bacterium]